MSPRPQPLHRISVRDHGTGFRASRSLVKTITYRVVLIGLAFLVVYLFIRQLRLEHAPTRDQTGRS